MYMYLWWELFVSVTRLGSFFTLLLVPNISKPPVTKISIRSVPESEPQAQCFFSVMLLYIHVHVISYIYYGAGFKTRSLF